MKTESKPITAGRGWRRLRSNEVIRKGDQRHDHADPKGWGGQPWIGMKVGNGLPVRRRVA